MTPEFLPLAGPAVLMAAACGAAMRPGLRPKPVPKLAEAAGLLAFASAVLTLVMLLMTGPLTAEIGGSALSRVDAVSAAMLLLVSFIGWMVLRYCVRYLDGEARQGAFTGWMMATLASVLLLVQAATLVQFALCWMATSLFLHRLLLFYPQRPAARRAAAKKFITARAADLSLAGAFILLWLATGSQSVAGIAEAIRAGLNSPLLGWAAGLLALAALLKSAQFPFHGWLTEVMDTPTPVSALLHAGVINAGGFLLIRFADVLTAAPGVQAALVLIGGFTALFACLVMLTQPAVKTALAWSTVAQMGFMVLQCGLALYALALLHILAHSLYKAHAFLSAGNAVAEVAARRRPGPVAVPSAAAVLRAFGLALLIYGTVAFGFALIIGFNGKSAQALALGAILIFGVAYLLAQGMAGQAPRALGRRTALQALAVAIGYFSLQTLAEGLFGGALPPPPAPQALEWVLIVLALVSFASVALLQAMFPLWSSHPAAAGLRVHLSNGFYINTLTDRLTGGWRLPKGN
jgi:NADH:ubiquinone oxidoreductase subunit 5 (subunit L)/multisubunit Na+/H+ antiporter MnhA subunit